MVDWHVERDSLENIVVKFLCIMWYLWRKRNASNYGDANYLCWNWCFCFLCFLFDWTVAFSSISYQKCVSFWQGSFVRHWNGYIWSIVPHGLMWCLWRERNSRCFEDIDRPIPDLKLFFFRTLLDRLFALQKKSFPSFFDFLDSCNFRFWFVVPLFTPCVLGCFTFDIYISYLSKKRKTKKRKKEMCELLDLLNFKC